MGRARARPAAIRAVALLPSTRQRSAGAFAAIVGLIHDHHWTEEDVMYPFLLERVPTFEGDAIRLENDHVKLGAAMGGHPIARAR